MSRNRVRAWNEASFTIQAGGRHAPLHPQAPKMTKADQGRQAFPAGKETCTAVLASAKSPRIQLSQMISNLFMTTSPMVTK